MRSAVLLAADGTAASLERTLEAVAPAVDEVVVSCRDDQRDAVASALSGVDYRLAIDPVPGGGPVADIRSGCRVARGRRTFVTTTGTAAVEPPFVTRLFEAADGDGAVAWRTSSRRPLAAVYDTDAVIDAAETTLGMGSTSMVDMLDRLTVSTVSSRTRANAEADHSTESRST